MKRGGRFGVRQGRPQILALYQPGHPSVLFEVKGPESHRSCMPKIVTEVKVKGDITDEQIETIERLIHYSPVHGMVEYGNTVESSVTRI